MPWSMIRLARIFAALTLVIAVFAVIPATDAAACTPEIPALEQVLNPHPSDTHGGEGVESGACAHGHCHHTASERHAIPEIDVTAPHAASPRVIPGDDTTVSFAPNGLKRPPRA
jgi:hypothetical protein